MSPAETNFASVECPSITKGSGAFICSQVTSDGTGGKCPKLCQRQFRLYIRKNTFTKIVVRCWNGLPRKEVESRSLKGFERGVGNLKQPGIAANPIHCGHRPGSQTFAWFTCQQRSGCVCSFCGVEICYCSVLDKVQLSRWLRSSISA